MLGIAFHDTRQDARAFYRRNRPPYPSILDPRGKIAGRLGVHDVPTVLFLDRQHRIVARIAGGAELFDLEDTYRRHVR